MNYKYICTGVMLVVFAISALLQDAQSMENTPYRTTCCSPLGQAIIAGKSVEALHIIENGVYLKVYEPEASIRAIVTPHVKTKIIGAEDTVGFPYVVLAAAAGLDQVISAIHQHDAEAIFLRDYAENDALMWAARQGHLSIVTLLLSYGLDPLYFSPLSRTSAFDLAMEKSRFQVLDCLVGHLLRSDQTERLPEVIWHLSGTDETELLQKYLELGIKDSYRGIFPRTSLMKAARNGKVENFKLLVKYGSDPYESGLVTGSSTDVPYSDYDPLTFSVGHGEMFSYLLNNYEYDLHKVFDGENYFHIAYSNENRLEKSLFLELIEKSRLDVNSVNKIGFNLLETAVLNLDEEYVAFFLTLPMTLTTIQKGLATADDFSKTVEQDMSRMSNNYNLSRVKKLKNIRRLLRNETETKVE